MKREVPVWHNFKKIHDYVEKEGNANLKEVGLTLAQGHVLRILKHSKDYKAPFKEVERQMHVAQSTTAGMVARLESNGFVEIYTDSEDKRIKIVGLTELGITSTEKVRGSMVAMDNKLLGNFTQEERDTLKQLLEKLTNNCK